MSQGNCTHPDVETRLQQAIMGLRKAVANLREILVELEVEETGTVEALTIAAQVAKGYMLTEQRGRK